MFQCREVLTYSAVYCVIQSNGGEFKDCHSSLNEHIATIYSEVLFVGSETRALS